MGDNLYIAREFSKSALADIGAMRAMTTVPSAPADIAALQLKLGDMQNGAKHLRARAIYQSAQSVIDILSYHAPSHQNQTDGFTEDKFAEDFNARLSGLNHLITQYEKGLAEVEEQLGQKHANQEALRNNLQGNNLQSPNLQAPNLQADSQYSHTAYETAKANLGELIHLCRADETQPLQRLMSYDVTLQKTKTETPEIKISEIKTSETETSETAPGIKVDLDMFELPQPALDKPAQIPLEYVLRDVIQDALSIARMSAKTISISYDVDQNHIGEPHIISLERRLGEGLRALILQSLPANGVGHIDISLQDKTILIQSQHPAPRLLPKGLECQSSASGCTITMPLIVHREITPQPATDKRIGGEPEGEIIAPLAACGPMITKDTEHLLREQLSGLLDWQNADLTQDAVKFGPAIQTLNPNTSTLTKTVDSPRGNVPNKAPTTTHDIYGDEYEAGL